jgi:predicted homoserine dehydrogenase-like protein
MPATASVSAQALPIGLASNIALTRPVKQDQVITMDDIRAETTSQAWQVRNKMLEHFS